ncbi:TPA: type I toxin-antitoxin system Fst family toxin, partial [Staphylococcus aureus]|nr:type I toxin-antitoxin system Fst family toxin [Staphylococcus aureus]HCU7854344.1 type I toxin-antitoxin system Fst family toxin [Staphylococcus aureus]HCU9754542.1 type I toxin-antitoxin system Fst family toxin [Staphylococcus aureus]HDA2541038.1 type I toxin-antitoxin system Fst family toxin [Staphylococcus aureus]HDG5379263.1 type I toxin-antitoxin system Fst family toxin [Staphylococcus aureus]
GCAIAFFSYWLSRRNTK